jgi:hypothetical protein
MVFQLNSIKFLGKGDLMALFKDFYENKQSFSALILES